MRLFGALIGLAAFVPFHLSAQESKPNPEYVEFSKLVHGIVVKQMPKQFEDASGWGQRIEVPLNLPLAKRRTIFKVGDRFEAPHGTWRRFVGKVEEPDKNLKIVVKDFKKLNDSAYRVVVDVDAIVMVDAEFQQWQKGLLLIGGKGVVDANVTAAVVCDVGVAINFKEFPPEVKLEPKVTELGLNLVEFKVRGGPILPGETGDSIRNELKNLIRSAMKSAEPAVKDHVNQAIAQSLKESRSDISIAAILKALPVPK